MPRSVVVDRPRLALIVGRATAVLLAGVVVSACSSPEEPEGKAPEGWSTSGEPTAGADVVLKRAALEDQVTGALPVDGPLGDYGVNCEGDLAGIVGARQVCAVVSPAGRTGVLVETVEVAGDDVLWDRTPFLFSDDLAERLPEQIRSQGGSVESVSCPAHLPGEVGAEMTCTATGGLTGVELVVTKVDGLQVDFNFEAW